MTIASVTTDINIGPYKIPSNGQNMIMNNYAQRNGLKVEVVIPEPIFSNELATTIWLNEGFKFTKIILCSYYQLPSNRKSLRRLLNSLGKVEFHFALEGLYGIGEGFINKCVNERSIFKSAQIIDGDDLDWLKLEKLFYEQKI